MKRFFFPILLLSLVTSLTACENTSDDVEPTPMPATTNLADGDWIVLFDGSNFDHWRGFQRDDVPGKWQIDQGAIYFNPDAEGDGGDIITRESFENFDFQFEWKIGECGNSGVFYHVAERDEFNRTYQTGPEYQVLDNTCHPDAENGPDRYAAANYALQAPAYVENESLTGTKPAGEWNTGRIVVNNGHVEHYLNGDMVVEYDLGSEAWNEMVAASKFDAMPGYGIQGEGHLALQDHSDPVWFRNLRVKRL